MADKRFVVTHPKARAPIAIKGKTLTEALEKEGLDPAIWKDTNPLKVKKISVSNDTETGNTPTS